MKSYEPLPLTLGINRALTTPITTADGRIIVPVDKGWIESTVPSFRFTARISCWYAIKTGGPTVHEPSFNLSKGWSAIPTTGTSFIAVGIDDIYRFDGVHRTVSMFNISPEMYLVPNGPRRQFRYACAGPDGNLYVLVRSAESSQSSSVCDIWRLYPRGPAELLIRNAGIRNVLVFAAPALRRGNAAWLCSVSNTKSPFGPHRLVGWRLDARTFCSEPIKIAGAHELNPFGEQVGDRVRDLAFDMESRLLVAHQDGVRIWSFNDGPTVHKLEEEIGVSTQPLNRLTFGGDEDRTLFVSTARSDLDIDDPSGRVFAIRMPAAGVPPYRLDEKKV